jgi:hypothetical protein
MTKEILSKSAENGEKTLAEIPKDILELLKNLPIVQERYNQMNLHCTYWPGGRLWKEFCNRKRPGKIKEMTKASRRKNHSSSAYLIIRADLTPER